MENYDELELKKYMLKRAAEWYGINEIEDEAMYEMIKDSYVARGWVLEFHVGKLRDWIMRFPLFAIFDKILNVVDKWLDRKN